MTDSRQVWSLAPGGLAVPLVPAVSFVTWVGQVSLPADRAGWAALATACGALVLLVPRAEVLRQACRRIPPAAWLLVLGGLAAGLSAAYVVVYLHGGPRIIDATSYLLEARTLARGKFTFLTPQPLASFHGRFLFNVPGDRQLGVIFPPGYPAVLALGVLAGVPMAVGPVIGGLLVPATYALARTLTARREVALLAAGLSVVCAALRYHTADTMSHGWSALLLTTALWAALRGGPGGGMLAGLASGWLVATRPVSGAVVLVVCGMVAARRRGLGPFLLGLVPGLALLFSYERATTGHWLGSSQHTYYALADGPPGCFRYGFGPGIGCLHEHSDFVGTELPEGFGFGAALRVTWRRVFVHLRDPFNCQLWGVLLLPLALFRAARHRRTWPALALVLGVPLGYLPFYFDGSYPGGGARLFSDILPVEHVLGAAALVQLGMARLAVPAMLVGFALQTSFDHAELEQREGGRPMFEPAVLQRARVTRGLVFVETDHGFNLAHQPGQLDAHHGLVVARLRRDAHDALLWSFLGHPPAYCYRYDPLGVRSTPSLVPCPLPNPYPALLEAESLWPPLAVRGGWVRPEHAPQRCVSAGRVLHLLATSTQGIEIQVELSVLETGRYQILSGWVARETGKLELGLGLQGVLHHESVELARGQCWVSSPLEVHLARGSHPLRIWCGSDFGMLDYMWVRPADQFAGPPSQRVIGERKKCWPVDRTACRKR